MRLNDGLKALKSGKNMDRTEAADFLGSILDESELEDSQIAEVLTLLTKKTVTPDEICGFVDAMRLRMVKLPDAKALIDTCGTGGDRQGTFNISTAAAILLAGGGVSVAKHGNRAATSKCGSADVLEALHVPVQLDPGQATMALQQHGFVFLFAPLYHPSLKRLAIVRRSLGFPTVFNLLGPLLNPSAVNRQVIGTFSLANVELLSQAMTKMDYEHAIVLTSEDGLDEASLNAPVQAYEIKHASVGKLEFNAIDYGLKPAPITDLVGGDAQQNARMITAALQPSKELNPHQRIIVFNAAVGFYVSGQAGSIEEGIQKAQATLNEGRASDKLKELATSST